MSKGNQSINVGINILLKIVGKLLKEAAQRVQLPLRGSLGWGGVGTESPLRYLTFFLFRNVFKKNKIIPGSAGAGRRKAEHPQSVGQPPDMPYLGGPALAAGLTVISFLKCSRLRTPQPPGPPEALQDARPPPAGGSVGQCPQERLRSLCSCTEVPPGAGGPGAGPSPSTLGSRA